MLNRALNATLRGGFSWLSKRSLPQATGAFTLKGLEGRVEIIRDRWGVPHITAGSIYDGFFAQGFVHAQDRLWQMDLNRRVSEGRLSELIGGKTLETDRIARVFGFDRLGQKDWDEVDPLQKALVEAYTAGVNALLEHPNFKPPIEYTLLRHSPEPWTTRDSMAFVRFMLWKLSYAWHGELVRAQLIAEVGPEAAAELEVHYPSECPVMLPDGLEFNRLDLDGLLKAVKGPFLSRGKGSNAWAVAGRLTEGGHPLMANDIHLEAALPSVWYEAHLHCDQFNVTGVTLPGLPLVVVGHNEHIAWGMTLAFSDCEDLFVERFDPERPHRYEYRGAWCDAEVHEETILIKGGESHVETVRVTRHGPVISGVLEEASETIAVQSMALGPQNHVFHGWLGLDRAHGWDDFVDAMHQIDAPPLNIMYADVSGNIGWWLTGRTPVRAKGDGMVPVPGWTGEYEWVEEVPFEEMPHALNPDKGYLVNCNHAPVDETYPHFLGNVWMNGYRAKRFEQLMADRSGLTIEDFSSFQADLLCLPGQAFIEHYRGLPLVESDDKTMAESLDALLSWDGHLTEESVGGAIYEVVRYSLIRGVLEKALGPALTDSVIGKGFHPLLKTTNEFHGHDTVAILRMLDNPESWWIQNAGGREAVLQESLARATQWLRKTLGRQVNHWHWGRIHRLIFTHPMGEVKPLDRVFNLGPVSLGGDTDTLCQTAIGPDTPYLNRAWSPTYRQIIDLGDFSTAISIHTPGQSGQLGSVHYDDLLEPWRTGQYHPMLWTRDQIEAHAVGKLELLPIEAPESEASGTGD